MSEQGRRLVVLVNGLPGAGKSTLVKALSAELGWPYLSKDVLKESLFDNLGFSDRDWSRRVGMASAEAVWALLGCIPGDALVESVFGPNVHAHVRAGLQRAGVHRVAEVLCDCPPELALRRFRERADRGERHPGHGRQDPRHWDEHDRRAWQMLTSSPMETGLGPLLRVDTTGELDIAAIAAWVRLQRGLS